MTVQILDAKQKVIHTETFDQHLEAGETAELVTNLNIGADFEYGVYTVQVTSDAIDDIDLSDNVAQIDLQFSDVAVTASQTDASSIKVDLKNNGNRAANGTLTITDSSGTVLSKDLPPISAGETYSYTLDTTKVKPGDLTITFVSEEDYITIDNSVVIRVEGSSATTTAVTNVSNTKTTTTTAKKATTTQGTATTKNPTTTAKQTTTTANTETSAAATVVTKKDVFYFAEDTAPFVSTDLFESVTLKQADGSKKDITKDLIFQEAAPSTLQPDENHCAIVQAYYEGKPLVGVTATVYIGQKGDVNLDGAVTLEDATLALTYYSEHAVQNAFYFFTHSAVAPEAEAEQHMEKLMYFLADIDTASKQGEDTQTARIDLLDITSILTYYTEAAVGNTPSFEGVRK